MTYYAVTQFLLYYFFQHWFVLGVDIGLRSTEPNGVGLENIASEYNSSTELTHVEKSSLIDQTKISANQQFIYSTSVSPYEALVLSDPCYQDGTCEFTQTIMEEQYCNCDKKCHQFKDCCHDIKYNEELNSVYTPYYQCYKSSNNIYKGLFAVAECPPMEDNTTILHLCQSDDFLRVGPCVVSDDIIFKNKYCAFCHNITLYKTFDLTLKLSGVVTSIILYENMSNSDRMNHIFHMSKGYQLIPPKGTVVRPCMLQLAGNNDTLCQKFINPVYLFEKRMAYFYRNYFCGPGSNRHLLKCTGRLYDRLGRDTIYPITILFSFTEKETKKEDCTKMTYQCFIRIFLISNCIAIKTIIRTKTGTIEGFTQSVLSKEVKTFLGIPYAEKPIGDLRFREPLPVNKWQNIKQTKAFQKACSQPAAFGTAVPFENQSEDCLYLNAWVPNGGCINKHAMIWIYFGGFIVGDIQRFDGKVLAASSDVIVFTLSYRTGPLGFLYLNDNAAPGNMGLMDQGLAIKWIYDNIKRFGGNRNKITLFGQSAGAASINYHMFSRVTQRYFQKAIIMSAAADSSFTYHSPEVALDTGKEFATQVGCKESTVESTLQCLRSLNASTLSALQLPPNPKPPVFFRAHLPTVDALSYVSKPPAEFLKDPFSIRPIPLLIGVLKNELSFFITYFVGVLQIPINVLDGIITKEEFFDLIPLSLDANNETLNAIAEYYLAPHMPGEPPSYIDVLNDIGSDLNFRCPVLDIAKTFANTYRRKSVYIISKSSNQRDQFKQELENLRQQKEESASRINVQEYEHQIQELKDQVIEKDKTVKMVQDLYFMRSTEFTDEIQTLKNEKSDLHSKLQSQDNSVKQLTEELQNLRHENYMLSSSQNQQRPNYNNRHYNNRRGGRFR
ncbi:BCHE [Mytilus edulis]|uniref:BCHE n=1 Tax=Mytilus edulis TaxID=6550 RepID=A0A8S3TQU7_MYTED|nr:BCHE [Mytilus edulis]